MHLQLYVRGINTQVKLWKIFAQSQFFKWTRKDTESGENFDVLYQMALRPSVLGTWELIFPEDCLATVLSMLGVNDNSTGIYGNVSMKGMRMAVLRKMCGVKKIPKKILKEAREIQPLMLMDNSKRGLYHLQVNGVAIHPIGIRKDSFGEMYDPKAEKTYYQELL